MTKDLPSINASLIKVVGVFNYTKEQKKAFVKNAYKPIPINRFSKNLDRDIKFIKDNYYLEYVELFFTKNLPLYFEPNFQLSFIKGIKNIEVLVSKSEVYFFPNDNTGIFSITLDLETKNLANISDLTYCASSFEAALVFNKTEYKFHDWISNHILQGVKLRGEHISSDRFSGSKFKIYTVIDIKKENIPENDENWIDYTLYEIGTRSRLNTMRDKGYNSASQSYFESIMENTISVFNNYKALALLDSFTVIGHDVYPSVTNSTLSDSDLTQIHIDRNVYDRIYFSMYIFNLYVKYTVFRYNATFKGDEVRKRDEFENFMNQYNLKHISFNFLPNIFFAKMRAAMMIEDEIAHFESRIQKFANKIQEDESKRQAMLLTIISGLTSISAIQPVIDVLSTINNYLQWPIALFYGLTTLLLLLISIPVLAFIFPSHFKTIKRKLGWR
jgi:hypothetical protein